MSEVVRCGACGGSVVYDIKTEGAACMFCGSMALSAAPSTDPIPTPDSTIPLSVDAATADSRYRTWAQSSWWYPRELRTLKIQIKPMLLPAWRFFSHLETHWAGLKSAATRSGKAPTSGKAEIDTGVMVPASGGISQKELMEIQPYDEAGLIDWNEDAARLPWEPPQLTEHGATLQAHELMASWHANRIRSERSLISCNVSPVITDQDVKLLMVPIYIGAFRYRKKPWRFLINAQTGEVVGDAPIDRVKVALVVSGIIAAILLVYVLVVLFA